MPVREFVQSFSLRTLLKKRVKSFWSSLPDCNFLQINPKYQGRRRSVLRKTTSQQASSAHVRMPDPRSPRHRPRHFRRDYFHEAGLSPSFLGRSNWCDSLAKKLKREQYIQRFFSTQLANKPSSSLPIPILADENDFIERLKSHDECAFETMVRRHGTRMLATACKIFGKRARRPRRPSASAHFCFQIHRCFQRDRDAIDLAASYSGERGLNAAGLAAAATRVADRRSTAAIRQCWSMGRRI